MTDASEYCPSADGSSVLTHNEHWTTGWCAWQLASRCELCVIHWEQETMQISLHSTNEHGASGSWIFPALIRRLHAGPSLRRRHGAERLADDENQAEVWRQFHESRRPSHRCVTD